MHALHCSGLLSDLIDARKDLVTKKEGGGGDDAALARSCAQPHTFMKLGGDSHIYVTGLYSRVLTAPWGPLAVNAKTAATKEPTRPREGGGKGDKGGREGLTIGM